jgi:hypothetical protein
MDQYLIEKSDIRAYWPPLKKQISGQNKAPLEQKLEQNTNLFRQTAPQRHSRTIQFGR